MPARSTWLRRALIVTAEAAVVGGAAAVLSIFVLGLRHANLHMPLSYAGDGNFYSMVTKSIIEHGWFFHNGHLGFPFGQELFDFPLTNDNLHLLAIKALTLGSSNYATVLNAFYLATYPVDALAAYFVLRQMGRSRCTAGLGALLFAFLPYHVFRGESHVMLAAYEAVPLGALLLYWQFQPAPMLFDESDPGWKPRLRNRRAIAAIVIALVLGATGAYYAVFSAVVLAAAGVGGLLAGWGWRRAISALALCALIAVSLGVNLAPSLLYTRSHGVDREARHADPVATEAFGLKLAQLVLPVPGHRIKKLASLEQKSINTVQPSETGENLGMIGAAGFLGLLAWGLTRLLRNRDTPLAPQLTPLAFGTLVMGLCGAVGGFSLLLALGGLPEIRSWNRVSLLIGFYALAAVGLALETAVARVKARRGAVLAGVVAVLLAFGIWDETTPAARPDYAGIKAAFARDDGVVKAAEQRLPRGAALFQLPFVKFPESPPVHNMTDYDHLRGYLHSSTLKWSYAEVKGRDHDWQEAVSALPLENMLPVLVGSGFDALWIDGAGYEDGGRDLAASLSRFTGPPIATSNDGRFYVFDLRPVAASLRGRYPDATIRAAAQAALQAVGDLRTAPAVTSVTATPAG